MRDQKDPGTLEMLPAKRGRPVLDPARGPMTAAEKQRRYRELRSARVGRIAHQAPRVLDVASDDYLDTTLALSDGILLDAIKREVAFLDRLMAGPQKGKGSSPSKKRVAAMVAELARRYPQK